MNLLRLDSEPLLANEEMRIIASFRATSGARRLQAEYNVTVLPGSYLAREAHGVNPGAGFVRIALVADLAECVEAARRIVTFAQQLSKNP